MTLHESNPYAIRIHSHHVLDTVVISHTIIESIQDLDLNLKLNEVLQIGNQQAYWEYN